MKKLCLAVAAIVGLALVAPIPAAQAETVKRVVIKRGHDGGHHEGWRHRHGGDKVVIVKKRRHHEM